MVEKSVGAVIFNKSGKKTKYLLLHYQSGHWDFPKGHIEKGETLEETAKREIEEETGLKDIEFVAGFKEWIKYFFKGKNKENIFKIATFLLAESQEKKVKISWEHVGYKWLTYEEALEQLTFENAKEILKKANKILNEQ